jgi:excinuclease ABC subunit A
MDIRVRGAREHNLKNIDVQFGDGLTVVTGVSGSGKTSLIFDTVYHEARRRFLDIYLYGRSGQRLAPADVEEITGLGPTIAVGQNLLNRNPLSTLASASGLHPFLRLLFTNYGTRHCLRCNEPVGVLTEDEIVERLVQRAKQEPIHLYAPLLQNSQGSHTTLLTALEGEFGRQRILVDGKIWNGRGLDPKSEHAIEVKMGVLEGSESTKDVRGFVQGTTALGTGAVRVKGKEVSTVFSTTLSCLACGEGLRELRAMHFNQKCPYCKGNGCERCDHTGMHPQAASVRWEGMRLPELLAYSVEEAQHLFAEVSLPSTADRLRSEIRRRLDALARVGLGYISLNRSAPTLSRGESQRVRLAISLTSRLEDMLHVLDEPTIGQHPADVAKFLPAFRELAGPVIFVEHDRVAASVADVAIDLGPGAGRDGGEVVFKGPSAKLWEASTATGRYFSLQDQVATLEPRPPPDQFITVQQANQHNLQDVDVSIPVGRMTVITGVSGSGKSTLVEHVLVPSLKKQEAIGCAGIKGKQLKPVLVDQSPIGRNPRSNPATYTKLSDIIRDLFAAATGLSKSHFSFNRPEGACPACKGLGASEVKMRFLPSIWIPCLECEGQRFNPEVLAAPVEFGAQSLTIAEFYATPIKEIEPLISNTPWLTPAQRTAVQRILQALNDVGLGYLALGQPSPTLSGGEAQRVKLTKFLGRNRLTNQLVVLDEPSTGLHPQDLDGLFLVLDRLVRYGATIVIVEHNTDFIRAADWIIDLGPGAGPKGGRILYAGPPEGLMKVKESATGRAVKDESTIRPRPSTKSLATPMSPVIAIRNARANNLQGVNVEIPKNTLTVVTGVSGSGKSSLVRDVLETEARRRYLETLSLYERQGTRETAEASVDSITGLGVTLTIKDQVVHRWSTLPQFTRRNTVGTISELTFHLANVLAALGTRKCLECGTEMYRGDQWDCPKCNASAPIGQPRQFAGGHWTSSCPKCHGLGYLHEAQPEKLIIQPDKPLCAGAMHSPGYWPRTYLCKDQPIIPELGKQYGFDPFKTPWNQMSEEARKAFLWGDGRTYQFTYISKSTGPRKGMERKTKWTWRGFYQPQSWLWDWDFHGTYTNKIDCPECNGAGLRLEFLAVTLQGKNIYELNILPLTKLEALLQAFKTPLGVSSLIETSLRILQKRLRFLRLVGIGYLHLHRPTGTLSAGEAQRVQLASLLGSGLTSLTILLDEPSRGMHPSELEALRSALQELRDEENTVIVVEHDPMIIHAADHIIDMGPGAGAQGGKIIAEGSPADIIKANTTTGKWLDTKRTQSIPVLGGTQKQRVLAHTRPPQGWMVVKGAQENNLQGETVRFPLHTLTGVCGVSGSGKSSLLIDTVGRSLVKVTHSSSFSREPLTPGIHDGIENQPKRTLLVDQSRQGIRSPAIFLGLTKPLLKLFAESDDAQALGLDEKTLRKDCSACRGRGHIRIQMDFLPDEWDDCETCQGTGYRPEAWEVRVNGVTLPEINGMTLDEVFENFKDINQIADSLQIVRQVGLGYLVWNQPSYTLSGGEAQRIKIVKELQKKTKHHTLYILDEPTVGLHMEDVARLIQVLNLLVESGNTVIVVEHHPSVLAACDWLIELGPVGGPDGGKVIGTGTPEEVARLKTPTAPYLREVLGVKP